MPCKDCKTLLQKRPTVKAVKEFKKGNRRKKDKRNEKMSTEDHSFSSCAKFTEN